MFYPGRSCEIAWKTTVLVTRSVIAAIAASVLLAACSEPSSKPSGQSPAASGNKDDWFINRLEAGGIQASYSRSWWIDAGHRTCMMLQKGMTPDQVAATIQAPGVPNSGYVVDASIQAYCPQYGR